MSVTETRNAPDRIVSRQTKVTVFTPVSYILKEPYQLHVLLITLRTIIMAISLFFEILALKSGEVSGS